MSVLVYGKRTQRWYDSDKKNWNEPDKKFAALNANGQRVTKLNDAFAFATKEDAEQWIKSHDWREGVELEIRKAK